MLKLISYNTTVITNKKPKPIKYKVYNKNGLYLCSVSNKACTYSLIKEGFVLIRSIYI